MRLQAETFTRYRPWKWLQVKLLYFQFRLQHHSKIGFRLSTTPKVTFVEVACIYFYLLSDSIWRLHSMLLGHFVMYWSLCQFMRLWSVRYICIFIFFLLTFWRGVLSCYAHVAGKLFLYKDLQEATSTAKVNTRTPAETTEKMQSFAGSKNSVSEAMDIVPSPSASTTTATFQTQKSGETIYECDEEGCVSKFLKLDNFLEHVTKGSHRRVPEKHTMKDTAAIFYKAKLDTVDDHKMISLLLEQNHTCLLYHSYPKAGLCLFRSSKQHSRRSSVISWKISLIRDSVLEHDGDRRLQSRTCKSCT